MVVITRSDLTPGQRAVQSAHSAISFCFENKKKAKKWHCISNNLVLLEVPTEKDLIDLTSQSESLGIDYSIFREPDLGNQVTAITLSPGMETKKLTQKLKLLLKNE